MNISKYIKQSVLVFCAISSIFIVLPTYADMNDIIPKYNTKDYAIYVYLIQNGVNSKYHLFSSDGQYCYYQNIDYEAKIVGGNWRRQDNHIQITYHAPKRTYFGLWNNYRQYTYGKDKRPFINIQELSEGFDHKPFLFGFGGDTPTKLAVFDNNIHIVNQPIPKGASSVFVGEPIWNETGYTLTAFSLKDFDMIKTYQDGNNYFLSLATTPNTLSDDEIANRPKIFEIQGNTLVLDDVPTYAYISNDVNTDVFTINHALELCQGKNPLDNLKRYYESLDGIGQEEVIMPSLVPESYVIHYQGNIDDGLWLERQ